MEPRQYQAAARRFNSCDSQVSPGSVAAGIPARMFGSLDSEAELVSGSGTHILRLQDAARFE